MGGPFKDFGEGLDGMANGLNKLEKLGFLPIFEWRKKNMLAAQELELEMDAQRRRHERTQRLEAAKVRITTMIALKQANEGMEKCALMAQGMDVTEEEIREHYALTARAAAAVCSEAIESQYARERAGMYAAKDIADNTRRVSEEEPSKTWLAKFRKYAGEMRDEEVMELWGKILAGEICKPGSFSLKTLDILSSLDTRYANLFQKLAPYVINETFIPYDAHIDAGIPAVKYATLESIGLITRQMCCRITGRMGVVQRDYSITPSPDCPCPSGCFDIPCSYLTPAGAELYKVTMFTRQESEHAADFFITSIGRRYGIHLVKKLETTK